MTEPFESKPCVGMRLGPTRLTRIRLIKPVRFYPILISNKDEVMLRCLPYELPLATALR